MTIKEILRRCRKTHGDAFWYEIENRNQYDQITVATKIKICCKRCGLIFEQAAKDHFNKTGCPVCVRKLAGRRAMLKAASEFTKKANKIHDNKFNYSKSDYQGQNIPITIICPIHGEFKQMPSAHLKTEGCQLCGFAKNAEARIRPFDQVMERIKYSPRPNINDHIYHEETYNGTNTKMKITCGDCGYDFWQRMYAHLTGVDCPRCANHGFDPSTPSMLYYLLVEDVIDGVYCRAYKIGITSRSIKARYSADSNATLLTLKDRLKIGKVNTLTITTIMTTDYDIGQDAYDEEQDILEEFSSNMYAGPKLLKAGNTELFNRDILGRSPI